MGYSRLSLSQPPSSRQIGSRLFSRPESSTSAQGSYSQDSSNKKRKLPPVSPLAPMFPYRFSSQSPLPAFTRTSADIIAAEKHKLLNSVSSFVSELLNKIKSMDDVQNINIETLKQDLNNTV